MRMFLVAATLTATLAVASPASGFAQTAPASVINAPAQPIDASASMGNVSAPPTLRAPARMRDVSAPAPVINAPAPVMSALAPAISAPAPMMNGPAPMLNTPAAVPNAPVPSAPAAISNGPVPASTQAQESAKQEVAVVAYDWAAARKTDKAVVRRAIKQSIQDEEALAIAASKEKAIPRRYSASSHPDIDKYEKFAQDFDEAKVPGCLQADGLKRQPTFIFGGLLALPFIAVAAIRGKCN